MLSSPFTAISELKALTALIRSTLHSTHLLQILARVFHLGAHQNNFLVTVLIGRLRLPEQVINLLRLLHRPNILPFNASIRILSDSSPSKAVSLFLSLKHLSLSPNDFTFSELFRACSFSRNAFHVFQLHAQVTKSRYSSDPFVCNALLSAYAKGVGLLAYARKLFDEMPEKGMVCRWTCLIAGHAQFGDGEDAISLFIDMIEENFIPEDDAMVSVLSACSSLEGAKAHKWLRIVEEYSNKDSAIIVLIYLYGKLGRVEESRDLFEKMRKRESGRVSIVAWNAMITSHVQNGEPIEALNIFHCMLSHSTPKPNHVTIASILSACAVVGDLNLGRWAHEYMKFSGGHGILQSNKILGTAFIDMYCKCGSLKEAKQVFDRMVLKDVVSFNAMIMGLAINGEEMVALRVFSDMEKLNIVPNDGSFLGLLCACTHSGMVDEGRLIFTDMQRKYSISPKLEHYACFTNLLARAGFIEEALEVVKTMPIEPNGLVWGSLLGACLVHFKVDVAHEVARRFFDADSENSAGYVMLSNVYAVDRNWEDIEELRRLMKVRGVRKQRGCSWISINGTLHEFHAGCSLRSQMEMIYCMLNSLSGELRSFC
ncbi:pentatricopeptide repeat-containing protein At3g12770 [Dendrobium catenatum]|uniref:Pentatricopeptide repeat-containing protein n=1 Tax=Dendrobium catenatum TaxID=906689 RepID=A0A2I0VKC8_9ASPA|nr:pentatricopeptide repeat-containing protein At3g12770 [Dendrobium catenatum]PKU63869.1 Pentatricopeptide repeat-containing protein [Dendrobium catenatum]